MSWDHLPPETRKLAENLERRIATITDQYVAALNRETAPLKDQLTRIAMGFPRPPKFITFPGVLSEADRAALVTALGPNALRKDA